MYFCSLQVNFRFLKIKTTTTGKARRWLCKFERVLRNLCFLFFPFYCSLHSYTFNSKARDISDTNRNLRMFRKCTLGTENRKLSSFNERAVPETRIDITLDYLNGADPNTIVSLLLMFYSHERQKVSSCMQSRSRLFNRLLQI